MAQPAKDNQAKHISNVLSALSNLPDKQQTMLLNAHYTRVKDTEQSLHKNRLSKSPTVIIRHQEEDLKIYMKIYKEAQKKASRKAHQDHVKWKKEKKEKQVG